MKKIISLIFIVVLIYSGSGIATNIEGIDDTFISSEWVVMFYLCGDNLLSAAQQQSLENIRTIGSTEEVNFAILIDSNGLDDTHLYYIFDETLEEQEWENESDMTDVNNLREFCQKIMMDFPSEHYALFISSNKGSGWQGVCSDDNGNGIMITMPEIFEALNDITNGGSNKLDVISVETCLGGNFEFRYQMKSFCDYYVGYADCGIVHPVYGFPYSDSLSNLVNNPSITAYEFAINIVDNFVPTHEPAYHLKTVLGATEQSKLDNLSNYIDELALIFLSNVDEYKDEILSALSNTRIYGEMWDISYFIDLYDFLYNLEIDDSEFINVKNQIFDCIDTAVVAKSQLEDDRSSGLNFYFPRIKSDYNYALRYDDGILPSSYEDTEFAKDNNWDEFLITLLGVANNTEPNKPNIEGTTNGKAGEEYEYILTANDPDGDDVLFCIDWGDDSEETCLGPYKSDEEVIVSHVWTEEDTYTIRVKSRDICGAESEWVTLEISMSKRKNFAESLSLVFLIGKIFEIEEELDGSFRVLPKKLFEISYNSDFGFSFQIFDETTGGFPCCGYIDPDYFYGIITARIIFGLWIIV